MHNLTLQRKDPYLHISAKAEYLKIFRHCYHVDERQKHIENCYQSTKTAVQFWPTQFTFFKEHKKHISHSFFKPLPI